MLTRMFYSYLKIVKAAIKKQYLNKIYQRAQRPLLAANLPIPSLC
jgi:hypothetical protein